MTYDDEIINKMLDHISKQKMIINALKKRLDKAEKILRKISLYDYIESGQYIQEVDFFVEESNDYFDYNNRKGKKNAKK